MIVVIPVCHKDESLVLKNLEWIAQLDGKIDGEAVISCPEGFDSASVLEQVTRIPTDRTHTIRYPEWGGDSKWPHPQNWAWQSTARAIYHTGSPWLWWEADATPVKKGWLKAIQNEYESASKPFMGCILDGDGWSTPHMAGVGVYPADVINYSTNAMLCRAAPFDIVLWPDIEPHTHRANHLIQHHVRENGDSTHFPDCASVGEIVHPGVVLFHRCKDGSLIDQLRNPTPRTAKLKAQRAFWFKKKLEPKWRSILKQTPWEAGFFELPSHDRECHFNCAITQQQDTKWLVSRRWQRTPPMTWRSDLVRHRLNPDLTIAESFPILLPKQCGAMEQHEDPRIINRGSGFSLGYCSWLMGAKFQAHQSLAALDANWNCQSTFHLIYGKNGPGPGAGTGHEKNWVWFYHDLALHVDYQFSPHIVLRVANETTFEEFKTETPLAAKWQHGHIRGGTPPVRIGDEYISFFHSSLPWRARQNRYFMGAYTFEAKPPFEVTRITPKPLLGGSEDDPRSLGGPLVVFPCAGILNDDKFLVTLGVNDQACAWIKIPVEELNKKFVK